MVGNSAVIRALGGILYCVSVNDAGTLAVWARELQQAATALALSDNSRKPTAKRPATKASKETNSK